MWSLAIRLIMTGAFLVVCGQKMAFAACDNGADLSGGYSISIDGPNQAIAGVIGFRADCSIRGKIGGVISSLPVNANITGTYNMTSPNSGVLTLNISGVSSSYILYVANNRNFIVGEENDGIGMSSMELKSQGQSTFSISSVNGSYAWLCRGFSGVQTGVDYFDGVGGYSGLNYYYSGGGGVAMSTYSGTYSVDSKGLVSISYIDGSGSAWTGVLGIDSQGRGMKYAGVSGPVVNQGSCAYYKQ